jgi:hypothetical protein
MRFESVASNVPVELQRILEHAQHFQSNVGPHVGFEIVRQQIEQVLQPSAFGRSETLRLEFDQF